MLAPAVRGARGCCWGRPGEGRERVEVFFCEQRRRELFGAPPPPFNSQWRHVVASRSKAFFLLNSSRNDINGVFDVSSFPCRGWKGRTSSLEVRTESGIRENKKGETVNLSPPCLVAMASPCRFDSRSPLARERRRDAFVPGSCTWRLLKKIRQLEAGVQSANEQVLSPRLLRRRKEMAPSSFSFFLSHTFD